MFTPEQIEQFIRAQQAVVALLKARFPNLTTEEAVRISGDVVKVVLVEVAR